MIARKIRMTPETRKKYHEKISKPLLPVASGFARVYTDAARITLMLLSSQSRGPSGPHSSCGGLVAAQVVGTPLEDGQHDGIAHAEEAGGGEHNRTPEHRPLISCAFGPEVDDDDAQPVKGVIEHGADERERDDAHN